MTQDQKPNFWTTMPGILTGTAAILTAITTGIVAIKNPPTPSNDEYPDIKGFWQEDTFHTNAVITQKGRGQYFKVRIDTRPDANGEFADTSNIKVDFPDQPGCCTGAVTKKGEFTYIYWSNGTRWAKEK
jgi:hypothetical protein